MIYYLITLRDVAESGEAGMIHPTTLLGTLDRPYRYLAMRKAERVTVSGGAMGMRAEFLDSCAGL